MSFLPLDGPSAQLKIAIGSATVVEAKVGGSALSERKVITLQPLNGKVYVYFADDGAVPSASTVSTNGLILFKNAKETYEASHSQRVYLLALSGTTDVVVSERS
jgi:hypothetical protein